MFIRFPLPEAPRDLPSPEKRRVSREIKVAELYGFAVESLQSDPSTLLNLAKRVNGPLGP